MPPSLDAPWHADAAKQARILQIIVAALVMGCLIFLLSTLSMGRFGGLPAAGAPMLSYVVCGFFLLEAPAWAVVMRVMTARARREIVNGAYGPLSAPQQFVKDAYGPLDRPKQNDPAGSDAAERDARYLLPVYQTKTIIGAAMFEGLGFFATIAYLIERNPISLGVAIFAIFGVAAHFPAQGRIVGWVERQLEAVEVERMTP
jgi:hypothetical protein